MISNPDKKGPVKIAKDKAASWTCANPYAVDNVNVAQGPKTGNQGLSGKRSSFIANKEAKAPLATIINEAYVKRAHEYAETEYTNGGSIHDNTHEKIKRHGVKLGRKTK